MIIPVYNGEAYLEECIRSVLAQTHAVQEIVVVDDGSTDRSAAIAGSFPGVTVLSQANSGVAASRNAGVQATTSLWLAFLDADDVWMPDKLTIQLATLEAEGADVCFTGRRLLYPSATSTEFLPQEEILPPPSREIALQLKRGLSFTPSCAVVRRDAFSKTRGFNPAATPAEDWDLWLQLAACKATFAASCMSLILYRNHAKNASSHGAKMYRASMDTFERQLAPAMTPFLRSFHRAKIRSNFLAAYARVNRDHGHPHIRLMLTSLASNPFGHWDRYRAMLHMLLTEFRLLPTRARA